jgi:DNA-binding ferritin-like protein (Dps family)
MTRRKLLSILQEETDGFKERSRLRDDVLDAMEQAYIKGKKEQLTLTDVVSTYCDCDKYHDRYEEANNNCNSCDKPLN